MKLEQICREIIETVGHSDYPGIACKNAHKLARAVLVMREALEDIANHKTKPWTLSSHIEKCQKALAEAERLIGDK